VRVLFAAMSEKGGRIGRMSIAEPFYFNRHRRARKIKRFLDRWGKLFGASDAQIFHLWLYLWPKRHKLFIKRAEQLVMWADDVYVEYSYFARPIFKFAKQHNKKIEVTEHDVIYRQGVKSLVFSAIIKYFEMKALRLCTRFFCFSKEDQNCFAEDGLAPELLPLPVNLRDVEVGESASFLPDALGSFSRMCLFVGSRYLPNERAAEAVYEIAKNFERQGRNDILFVVVGECHAPKRDGNFLATGHVAINVLDALYRRADLIVVPLLEGTGASVKCVEAMAYGKVVLASSVGARGLEYENGVHLVIAKTITDFPEMIDRLLSDEATRKKIGSAARALVAHRDYRHLFLRYLT